MIKFLQNIGDYFSTNYFDEDFAKKVLDKSGYAVDDQKIFFKKISALKDKYYRFKQTYIEQRSRTKDKVTDTHQFHSEVLSALGYPGDQPEYNDLYHLDENTVLPVRHTLYRGTQPHLMIMEMQALLKIGDEEPDGLFEQRYNIEEGEQLQTPPQKYHRSQWDNVFKVPEGKKISPMVINKAVSELFLLPAQHRPRYILLCAGNVYFLLEQEKWFRGSYLQFNLEDLFDDAATKREYYGLFYFLLAKDALAPQSDIVLMEQLDEESHKSAYEVTKDLKEGVIHAVENIANEAVFFLSNEGHDFTTIDANKLKDDCLTMVYRLLFLFYAESREDLDILPSNDDVYEQGYSLEMLRDLEQVPLNTASSKNGFFFHESLYGLFRLLSTGYRENQPAEVNKSFKIRHLDSPMFDDLKMHYLPHVKLRNFVWQDVICQLSLSRHQRGKSRGRISYANLGINQLGSVYESLLAFRGFLAETDYIEVHRKRKSNESSEKVANADGSWLVPRHRLDDFDMAEVYHDKVDRSDEEVMRVIKKGTFIYRLSGRDRQNSASYYTPEVLTQCTVKYTLKPILERLEKKEIKALDLLKLKILEPAMGAAAFHNEVINQLAEAYLTYRQQEKNTKVAPDKYREEIQKIKAYIALNNVYGVDLNPTAVELGKLSLWLNVIHKEMQTPFFGYRLGVGNAVVGAWLKVYKHKDFSFEPQSKTSKNSVKKEWWDKAPKHLKFSASKIQRTKDEIYHFLLPDKNMVPSAGLKMLKDEYKSEAQRVTEWRKDFCAPLKMDEYERLQKISNAIDNLLEEHYQFQARVNAQTQIRGDFFGAYESEEQMVLKAISYNEKAKLAEGRSNTNAPYYKLKLIMDYWCSLWFWDMRHAADLPTRQEWYDDLVQILNIDLDTAPPAPLEKEDEGEPFFQTALQGNLFGNPAQQLTIRTYRKEKSAVETALDKALNEQTSSLFENQRSAIVRKLAQQYRFFHYELEFIEVFRERNGFDVAVGNPPWLKLQFEEKGLMSEIFPEIVIRDVTAPQVRKLQSDFINKSIQKKAYLREFIETEAISTFLNALQNYPLLKGQQTNLYKCVLENGFHWINHKGNLGLVHPESVYDDPIGQGLRREMYKRLNFHFQFHNALYLFQEIKDGNKFSINVYGGDLKPVHFINISNLYHPSTIEGCLIKDPSTYPVGGLKTKTSAGYVWNTRPHTSRKIEITGKELKILARAIDDNDDWQSSKFGVIHSQEIMMVLEKLSQFPTKVRNFEHKISEGWHETNDVSKGYIQRKTVYPIESNELILNGPHLDISNPFSQNPRKKCVLKSDYDSIDLTEIDLLFYPRTNYIPNKTDNILCSDGVNVINESKFLTSYKLCFRKMLSQPRVRTLLGALYPPMINHVNGIISIIFQDTSLLVELAGLSSSIVFDFYIKTIGKSNLYGDTIEKFPLGINRSTRGRIIARSLLLNALNQDYSKLWSCCFLPEFRLDRWSLQDDRLPTFESFSNTWNYQSPIRNYFARRYALIEIDVLSAMALNLSLEDLMLIYDIQFPVLQKNEEETWYDRNGLIVFSTSQSLSGVGLDRSTWESVKDLRAGYTYEHTITKSELYYGKKVTYHAPFDKCDRVEDYKTAWAYFEKVFREEK